MERKHLLFNSATVCYLVGGSGKAVILVHGFGESSQIWKLQSETLQQHFRVIVPDIPGSGYSTIDQKACSLNDYAVVIKRIMDEEKIKTAAVIGHSMGGYIALAFAELFQHNICKLGMFQSTAYADNVEKKEQRKKAIQFVKKYGASAILKESLSSNCTEKWKIDHLDEFHQLQSSLNQFSDNTITQYYQLMTSRPDRSNIIKNANYPILYVIGQHDLAIPFSQSMKECHLAKETFVHILNESAHLGMREESETSNRLLQSFLSAP
jgi:hypothetical protein